MSLTAWLLSWYSTAWIPARLCSFDTRPGVVEEHHLRWLDPEPLASQGVDPGIGLAHPALVGVDDLLDEVFEPVGGLFTFPGADEAVAHDPGAVPRAQPASVLDQVGVGGGQTRAARRQPRPTRAITVVRTQLRSPSSRGYMASFDGGHRVPPLS